MPTLNLFSTPPWPGGDELELARLELIDRGPLLDVVVSVPPVLAEALTAAHSPLPQPVVGRALLDTGASISGIDEGIAQALKLVPTGVVKLASATETRRAAKYVVSIAVPSSQGFSFDAHSVVGMNLANQSPPLSMIIGTDLLRDCQLTYNGVLGIVTLAY